MTSPLDRAREAVIEAARKWEAAPAHDRMPSQMPWNGFGLLCNIGAAVRALEAVERPEMPKDMTTHQRWVRYRSGEDRFLVNDAGFFREIAETDRAAFLRGVEAAAQEVEKGALTYAKHHAEIARMAAVDSPADQSAKPRRKAREIKGDPQWFSGVTFHTTKRGDEEEAVAFVERDGKFLYCCKECGDAWWFRVGDAVEVKGKCSHYVKEIARTATGERKE